MTRFSVYSASTDPTRLYSTDDSAGDTAEAADIDAESTVATVWAGDRPHDLVVDLGRRRLWWAFQADRETKARRTGHFIAAYQSDSELFRGVAEELRRLHDTDGWALPHTGDIATEAGYQLWRLPSTVERESAFDRLVERVRDGNRASLRVGMESYRSAFTTVRALDDAGVKCTVAVDERRDVATGDGVDLLLVPGADADFEILSAQGSDTLRSDTPAASGVVTADAQPGTDGGRTQPRRADTGRGSWTGESPSIDGFAVRIAGVVLVGLLGFSAFSFVTRQPVQPISGLATFGGFLGALGAVAVWHATGDSNEPLERWLRSHEERVLVLVALGTFAGFVYPRLLWELGDNGFLFGSLASLSGSIPATVVYVGGLFAITVAVLRSGPSTDRVQPLTEERSRRLAAAFVVYGLCLLIATGLAQGLWYAVIPAT